MYPLLHDYSNVDEDGTFDFGPKVDFVGSAIPWEEEQDCIPAMRTPATEVAFPERIQAKKDLQAFQSSPPVAAKKHCAQDLPPMGLEARKERAVKYLKEQASKDRASIMDLSVRKRRNSEIHASPPEAGRASSSTSEDHGGEKKKRKAASKKPTVPEQPSVAGFMKGHDDWLANMLGGI